MAAVTAVKVFDFYLHDQPFELIVDHTALQHIFSHTNTSARLARWALALQHLPMIIRYRKGTNHGNADALSRMPQVNYITRVLPTLPTIANTQDKDTWLSAMKHWIQHQSLPERITTKTRRQIQRCAHNYLIYNDALYYAEGAQHRQLVIPTEYTAHIIREFHDAP